MWYTVAYSQSVCSSVMEAYSVFNSSSSDIFFMPTKCWIGWKCRGKRQVCLYSEKSEFNPYPTPLISSEAFRNVNSGIFMLCYVISIKSFSLVSVRLVFMSTFLFFFLVSDFLTLYLLERAIIVSTGCGIVCCTLNSSFCWLLKIVCSW